MIKIVIAGEPVAAPRPRVRQVRTKDGRSFASAYNPAFYSKYRDVGKLLVMQAVDERCPYQEAVRVTVEVHVPIPTSMSGKKQHLALMKVLRPVTRPDCDNYLKTALDLLTGIVLRDDSIVVDARVQKFYSHQPRMEIIIEELSPAGSLPFERSHESP